MYMYIAINTSNRDLKLIHIYIFCHSTLSASIIILPTSGKYIITNQNYRCLSDLETKGLIVIQQSQILCCFKQTAIYIDEMNCDRVTN